MGDLPNRICGDRMVCISSRMAGDGYSAVRPHIPVGAGHDRSVVDRIESNLGGERASVAWKSDVDCLD